MFEASVGGGIPIIRPLNSCLTADEIEEITGIVNGTTNYMLSKMTDEGVEFEAALKDAQAKGYAEKDPTADVEGYDSCRKIAILTSLVCGQQVDLRISIPRESQRFRQSISVMRKQWAEASSFLPPARKQKTAMRQW